MATEAGAATGGTVAAGRGGVFAAIWCSRNGSWALPADPVEVARAGAPELGNSEIVSPAARATTRKEMPSAVVNPVVRVTDRRSRASLR